MSNFLAWIAYSKPGDSLCYFFQRVVSPPVFLVDIPPGEDQWAQPQKL